MGFSIQWVKYNPIPDVSGNFSVLQENIPFLDFGIQYGDAPSLGNPQKHVIGLKFQGTNATSIKVWLPNYYGDIYNISDNSVVPRIDISTFNFVFKAISTREAGYSSPPSTWSNIPSSEGSAISLGNATINKQFEAFSDPLGIGLIVPSTFSITNFTAQNISLFASFETDDQ